MSAMKAGVGIDPGLGLSRAQQRDLVLESARLHFESFWTPPGLTGPVNTLLAWWKWGALVAAVFGLIGCGAMMSMPSAIP